MKRLFRIVAIIAVLIMVFTHVSVSSADSKKQKEPVVAYEVTEYTIIAGKSQTIAPIVQNYSGRVSYTYTSENENIAKVNSSGRVTGINPGTVMIHCHAVAGDKEFDLSYSLTVTMLIKRIKVSKNKVTLNTNETYAPEISFEPENASDKTLKWTTSDSDVAYVDKEGVIHAYCTGKCTLTGTAVDGSNAKINITVEVPAAVVPTDDIIIDDPEGAVLIYTLNKSKGKDSLGWRDIYYSDSYESTNDNFSMIRLDKYGEEIVPKESEWVPVSLSSSYSKEEEPPKEVLYDVDGYTIRIIKIKPEKQGNGKCIVERRWYDGNRVHTEKYSINVKVARNAVYVVEKFANYGKNKGFLGQRFAVNGTVKSHETREEKCIIVLNADDISGQYAIAEVSLPEEIEIEDGMRLTIKGIFDHMEEYTAPSGLSYDAPFFNAEKLETE